MTAIVHPMPLRLKAGKPYPFVKIEGNAVLFTLVTRHAGDGYGYISFRGDCDVVHEFMSDVTCEQSLSAEGYRPLRAVIADGLLPADFILPTDGDSHGSVNLKP